MIDRVALEKIVSDQIKQMGAPTGASLFLHLHSGERYPVSSLVEYHDTYFVAAVYPQQALAPDDLAKVLPRDLKGNFIFDRLIIPYHVVAYVELTAREPEKRSGLGFKA
jgi:hypothetical protein